MPDGLDWQAKIFQIGGKKISPAAGGIRQNTPPKRVDKGSTVQYDAGSCYITPKRVGEIHHVVTGL
jgi:hypothetical protein